jgi:excisionase family DNA binding protein
MGGAMVKAAEKKNYRPRELAEAIDMSLRTIYRWICEERITHVHCGGAVRIPTEEFERVLKEGPRRIRMS